MSLTTIAVAGPDRSGVAAGVPVPRRTTFEAPGRDALDGCWPPAMLTRPQAANTTDKGPVSVRLLVMASLASSANSVRT